MPEVVSQHEVLPQPSARLESLRGLAAIQVALYHALLIMGDYPSNRHFLVPAFFLINGRCAVTLFFVLSGFVLGLSLRRSKGEFRDIYWRYGIRRVFRIYPTIVVSTFAIALYIQLVKHFEPTPSAILNLPFSTEPILTGIIQQLFFIKFTNPVTWTLRIEMICSLLLPLLLLVERLRPWLFPWLLAVLILAAFLDPNSVFIVYLPPFLVGYLLPLTYFWWQAMQKYYLLNAFILILGMVALITPRSLYWSLPSCIVVESIGAFAMIGCIVYGAHLSVFKILDHHFIKAAGRVSYGYYCYHPMCLSLAGYAALHGFPVSFLSQYPVPAAIAMWMLSSSMAFPIASWSYTYIEKPLINYAKNIHRPGEAVPV